MTRPKTSELMGIGCHHGSRLGRKRMMATRLSGIGPLSSNLREAQDRKSPANEERLRLFPVLLPSLLVLPAALVSMSNAVDVKKLGVRTQSVMVKTEAK